MTTSSRRQQILRDMNALTCMERGKLCIQNNSSGSRPFYKLQSWQQGKNHTRYVPADEVSALQEALANHQRFQQLAEEFVTLTVDQTRKTNTDSKKNSRKSSRNATVKPKLS